MSLKDLVNVGYTIDLQVVTGLVKVDTIVAKLLAQGADDTSTMGFGGDVTRPPLRSSSS